MNKGWLFLILFFVILLGFALFFGLYEVQFLTGRASIKRVSFSIENSYIFITPLQARANEQEKIRMTVFVLDDQGLGVGGKKVTLVPNEALKIEVIQEITDNYGKSYFDISSGIAGEYLIDVSVDGQSLNQTKKLLFK